MTEKEYDVEYRKMYNEYKKYDYRSEEAKTIWWNFFDTYDLHTKFYRYKEAVSNRVYKTLGFKLSAAQEKIVKMLICDMVEAKLGKDWILNHYEYKQTQESTVIWIFENYYEKGLFLERMNTRTLQKLSSLGIIEAIEVGGTFSDTVKPLFDFELTEEEKNI